MERSPRWCLQAVSCSAGQNTVYWQQQKMHSVTISRCCRSTRALSDRPYPSRLKLLIHKDVQRSRVATRVRGRRGAKSSLPLSGDPKCTAGTTARQATPNDAPPTAGHSTQRISLRTLGLCDAKVSILLHLSLDTPCLNNNKVASGMGWLLLRCW